MSRVPPPGLHHDYRPGAWRATGDDDTDRLDRYATALGPSRLDAVLAVADSEQSDLHAEVDRWRIAAHEFEAAYVAFRENGSDARRALERVREVADLWETLDPDATMTRAFAGEHLRRVLGP